MSGYVVGGGSSGNLRPAIPWGSAIQMATNSSDVSNDIDFLAGDIALQKGTEWKVFTLGSTLTKRVDATFAEGTNQGALDTGSVADSTYHWWAIGKDDGTIDFLASLSLTAPTMPTGYSWKARQHSAPPRVAGVNRNYTQRGNYFQFATRIRALNSVAISLFGELIAMPVPEGVRVGVYGTFNGGAGNFLSVLVLNGDQTGTVTNSTYSGLGTFDGTSGFYYTSGTAAGGDPQEILRITNTSRQIYFRRNNGTYHTATYQSTFQVHGWEDFLL